MKFGYDRTDFLRALEQIDDIADSAGDPEEQLLEIRSICKEMIE